METRTIEETGIEPEHTIYSGIRWGSVIAGFAVGVGIHLLLMLIGVAAGFAVYGTGARPEGESMSIAAVTWNTVSMLIAAFVGGYVAARGSGLRRTSDGVLHGVVSWGATVLFFAIVTGSVTGNALSGMFGMAATTAQSTAASPNNDAAMAELFASIQRGDRAAATAVLRERLGMSEEQAAIAVDQAMALRGQASNDVARREGVTDAAQAASIASTWLSAAILLSLLAGAGGGMLGARGARLRSLPGRYGERRVVHARTVHRVPTAG
ncbi:hypothetical protein [Azoarcus olearius]|uniref:Conserved hypothetical membrane protein n=1 Tax=Azoarcus sp. (strain BH72) TaxID=418699 RepID=A1K699_AZOSB|nr:hypothetical protein [Azoarcus olearius]CAL94354.1 conserved hypothetical membrane protein [Azoarcus olearius]